jgi:serine/threonine protein phosphatase PrpC
MCPRCLAELSLENFMIQIAHHADPGPRPNMEDSVAAAVLEVMAPLHKLFSVAAVCDGVGGANAGEIASYTAVSNLVQSVIHAVSTAAVRSPVFPVAPDMILSVLQNGMAKANSEVLREAQVQPERAGMAATAVCAVICDGLLFVVWAGDSRCYVLHRGQLRRLTRDHSQVEELMAAGHLTAVEARHHPGAHTITQYVGKADGFHPETQILRLSPGDLVLLCSDGCHDVLTDDQIQEYLANWNGSEDTLSNLAATLVQSALDAGTHDNTSVLLCQYRPSATEAALSAPTSPYPAFLPRVLFAKEQPTCLKP